MTNEEIAQLKTRAAVLERELAEVRARLAMSAPMFTITRRWMNEWTTLRGAWNARQLAAVGIAWPPAHGWRRRLEGLRISLEQKAAFERLSGRDVGSVLLPDLSEAEQQAGSVTSGSARGSLAWAEGQDALRGVGLAPENRAEPFEATLDDIPF